MRSEWVDSFDVAREVYEKNINHPKLLALCEGKLPGLKSRTLVEEKEGPGPDEHFWRFRCELDYDLPAAAKKVLGEKMGWFEDSVLDRAKHTVRFKVTTDNFQGRYRCEGEQVFACRDDGGFDRIMTIDLTVDITLVGRLIERHILENLKKTYAVEVEIQREFFRDIAK